MPTLTSTDHIVVARRYAAQPEEWPLAPRFNPTDRWYHRLAEGPDFEVWLLSWLPGQGTDLHDHGGSAGAFFVVSGTLTESTLDGPELRARTVASGQGRRFGPHHIHQITNQGDRPAVSVHVYGPALRTMTRYRLDDGRLSVAAVDSAGADW